MPACVRKPERAQPLPQDPNPTPTLSLPKPRPYLDPNLSLTPDPKLAPTLTQTQVLFKPQVRTGTTLERLYPMPDASDRVTRCSDGSKNHPCQSTLLIQPHSLGSGILSHCHIWKPEALAGGNAGKSERATEAKVSSKPRSIPNPNPDPQKRKGPTPYQTDPGCEGHADNMRP